VSVHIINKVAGQVTCMQASFIITLQAGLLALDRGAESKSTAITLFLSRGDCAARWLAGANINLNITAAKNAVE
jgi:hypothetical protein